MIGVLGIPYRLHQLARGPYHIKHSVTRGCRIVNSDGFTAIMPAVGGSIWANADIAEQVTYVANGGRHG